MTIGLLTPYFPDQKTTDSGIANHCLLLAQGLTAAGNKVVVIHIRPAYNNEDVKPATHNIADNIVVITHKITPPAITRYFKNRWALIDFTLKIKCMRVAKKVWGNEIYKHGIQVVETSSYFSLGYFLSYRKINIPVAVRVSTTFLQILNEHYPFKSRVLNWIGDMEIRHIKKSPNLVTHSLNHANELHKLYGINPDRFTIVPHGINLPGLNNELPINNGIVKLLYVGRLEYRKGIDVLLQAIPAVFKQNANVVLEIIGNDDDKAYQREFLSKHPASITDRVIFSGKVSNEALQQAYRDCDAFVAPLDANLGLIYVEAMSYAKPVIGWPVGGVAEIITDRHNGLLAQPGDAINLAEKILLLAGNAQLRAQMGANARQTVVQRFTKEILAENAINYYKQITGLIS